MGRTVRLLASVATAVLLAGLVVMLTVIGSMRSAAAAERPNIVFVLTDDLDNHSLRYLDGLRNVMSENGTIFSRAYVSDAVCCPSRATILRGQYPHNHGIRGNVGPAGGHDKFRNTMKDQSTAATWLNRAGYQTKFIGKYLNGYNEMYEPPGWDDWFAWLGKSGSQRINDNGKVRRVRGHDTDLFADESASFIRGASTRRAPFFLSVWTRGPHQPAQPRPPLCESFQEHGLAPFSELRRG